MAITSAASVTLFARSFAVKLMRPASSMRTTWRSLEKGAYRQPQPESSPRHRAYDHCNFTVLDGVQSEKVARFCELLLGCRTAMPKCARFSISKGLKAWVPGRVSGYAQLSAAVDRFGTIDAFVTSVAGAMQVDLGSLAFAEGGYLLVKRAVRRVAPGEAISVTGEAETSMWTCAPGAVPKVTASIGKQRRERLAGRLAF